MRHSGPCRPFGGRALVGRPGPKWVPRGTRRRRSERNSPSSKPVTLGGSGKIAPADAARLAPVPVMFHVEQAPPPRPKDETQQHRRQPRRGGSGRPPPIDNGKAAPPWWTATVGHWVELRPGRPAAGGPVRTAAGGGRGLDGPQPSDIASTSIRQRGWLGGRRGRLEARGSHRPQRCDIASTSVREAAGRLRPSDQRMGLA